MGGTRHVWVKPAFSPVQLPGLVLAWRQSPDGWEALVTYVEGTDRAVTAWVPAEQLHPVASTPSIGSAYG